jgi:hypothetical protein
MRSLVVLAIALGCGGPQRAPLAATWSAPPLLAHVPDDSPYVLASLDPPKDMPSSVFASLENAMASMWEQFSDVTDEERAAMEPWMRAALVVFDELRGKPVSQWFAALGLSVDPRIVIYGLSVYPVARMEIGDPAKLRSIIERAASAADLPAKPQRTATGAYWVFATKQLSMVVAIDDRRRQVIAAALPTAILQAALPHLLGETMPERSLAATRRVPDLLARYSLPSLSFGYLDLRLAAEALTRAPTAFDRPWRDAIGAISPACRDDIERLSQAFPLVLGGFRSNDSARFDGSFVVEVPPHVTTALARMQTTVPPLPSRKQPPLFALGAAIDLDALVAWVGEQARGWLARPNRCEWLGALDGIASKLDQVATTQPAALRGLRGLTLVVDNMEPTSIEGDLLLVGDHVYELPKLLGGLLPPIAKVPLASDGRPIPIPLPPQLGLPIASAHFGARSDRLALAVGRDSDRRVTDRLAAQATRAPILVMAADMVRVTKILERLNPAKAKEQSGQKVDDIVMTLELRPGALDFKMTGTWAPATASDP